MPLAHYVLIGYLKKVTNYLALHHFLLSPLRIPPSFALPEMKKKSTTFEVQGKVQVNMKIDFKAISPDTRMTSDQRVTP